MSSPNPTVEAILPSSDAAERLNVQLMSLETRMRKLKLRLLGLCTILAAPVAAVCMSGSAKGSVVAWNLVSALDPNSGTSQITISDATSNSGIDGVTLANFTTLVSTAYSNGLGGVFSFETGSGGTMVDPNTQLTTLAGNTTMGYSASNNVEGYDQTPNSYAAASGAPATPPIVAFYRSDSNASSSTALDWNSNQGAVLASGDSGGGYLGIQGTSSYSLAFQPATGDGVVDFGITDIARANGGGTSGGAFTVHFSDGSSITSSATSLTGPSGPTGGTGTFFGFQAPAGLTITSIDWANSGSASRFDDLALVVAPVPEPASLGLLSLGSLALLRRRRA
jgi:PEP-CTERM motif